MNDLESQIQLNRARGLIERGEKQAAYELLQKVMKTNQRIPEAWFIASLLTEKEARRIEMLQNALKLRPDYPEAKLRLESILHPSDVPVTADLNDYTQRTPTFAEPTQRTPVVLDVTPHLIDVVYDEDSYESSIPRRPSTRITDTSEFMGDPLLRVAAYRYEEEIAELERYQNVIEEEDAVPAKIDDFENLPYIQPDPLSAELEQLAQAANYTDEYDTHAELDKILKNAAYNQIEDDQESVDFPVVIPRATSEIKAAPAPRSTAELKAVKRNAGKTKEPAATKRKKDKKEPDTIQHPPDELQELTPVKRTTGPLQEAVVTEALPEAIVIEPTVDNSYAPTFVETYESEAPQDFPTDEDYATDEMQVATEFTPIAVSETVSETDVALATQRPPFPLPWTSTWSEIQGSWLQGAGDTGSQIGRFLQAQIVSPLKLALVVVWVLWMVLSPYTVIFYTVFLLALAYSPERPYVLETLDRWITGVANYLKRVWAWLRYRG